MNKSHHIQEAYKLRNRIRNNPREKTELLLQMADSYLKGESFANADMVCRTILKLEPMNMRAMVRMGKASLGTRQSEKAIKTFTTITQIVPNLEEGLWGLWAALCQGGQYKNAIEPLEQLLEKNTASEKILIRLTDTCERAGSDKKTIKYLKALIEKEPSRYEKETLKLSKLLHKSGDKASSLKYLSSYLANNRDDLDAIIAGARTAAEIKNWNLCARFATLRIESGPFSPEGAYLLGVSRIEQGKFDEAILTLEQLVDKLPEPLTYRMALGEAYFKNNELTSAQREFSRCLVRHPERDEIVLRLAEISWRKGERESASRLYERVLRQSPSMALALFRLGFLKFDKGLYPAAISLFRRLLVISPDNYKGNLHLGQALRLTGSYEKAKVYLQRSLELVPDLAKAELELGLLYKTLRKTSLSREHLQNAVRKDPDGPWGKDALYELHQLSKAERSISRLEELPLAVNGNNRNHSPAVLRTSEQKTPKVRWLKLS